MADFEKMAPQQDNLPQEQGCRQCEQKQVLDEKEAGLNAFAAALYTLRDGLEEWHMRLLNVNSDVIKPESIDGALDVLRQLDKYR